MDGHAATPLRITRGLVVWLHSHCPRGRSGRPERPHRLMLYLGRGGLAPLLVHSGQRCDGTMP